MYLKIVDEEEIVENERAYWENCNAKIYHYYYTQTALLLSFARTMPAFALLKEWLPKEGLILDAGCSCQEIASLFQTEKRKFLGIDFAVETLKSGKKVFPQALYLAADLRQVPLASESLEFVFAKGIAEHFAEGPQAFLKEMQRILKPQGKLMLMTNSANIEDFHYAKNEKTPYPHLMKKLSAYWVDGFEPTYSKGFHAYAFPKSSIVHMLRENGFRIRRSQRVGFLDGLMRSRKFGEKVKKFATERRIAMVQGKPTSPFWQLFDDFLLRERVYPHILRRMVLRLLTSFYCNYDALLCERI